MDAKMLENRIISRSFPTTRPFTTSQSDHAAKDINEILINLREKI